MAIFANIFPPTHPLYLTMPLIGFAVELCNDGGALKTRTMPLPEYQKSDDISIPFDTILKVVGETDGQSKVVKQYRILHALYADAR